MSNWFAGESAENGQSSASKSVSANGQVIEKEIVIIENREPRLESGESNNMSANEASVEFQKDYRQHLLTKMNGLANQQPAKNRHNKDINYYVRGLMQELVGNMKYVNSSTPIAVTSFVMLDGDFQQSDILGKQLSESFIHEVHKYGIPVIDFKTTDFVRVTPNGDFVFSKDYLELSGDLPIKYAVAGTLTKQQSGYLVNARIIGIESKAVVASAQGFLPSSVTNSLVSKSFNDGLPLTSSRED